MSKDSIERIAELLNGLDRQDVHRSIGQFVFEFSRLEYALRDALAESLSLNDGQFDLLLPVMDFALVCTACRNAFDKHFKGQPKRLRLSQSIVNEALELNNDRVRVVHGLWILDLDSASALHTARGSLKQGEYFKERGYLDKKSEQMGSLRKSLLAVFNTAVEL